MPRVNPQFYCKAAEVLPGSRDQVRVEVTDAELDEVIHSIGTDTILDEIGEKACRAHFGIEGGD